MDEDKVAETEGKGRKAEEESPPALRRLQVCPHISEPPPSRVEETRGWLVAEGTQHREGHTQAHFAPAPPAKAAVQPGVGEQRGSCPPADARMVLNIGGSQHPGILGSPFEGVLTIWPQ